jgi:uncharacterized protein (UPF0210 family)
VKYFSRVTVLIFLLILAPALNAQNSKNDFRIRTITAGVTLSSLADTLAIRDAILFLKHASEEFTSRGYEVQTLRISTQNFYLYSKGLSTDQTLASLITIDRLAGRNNIRISIGQILPPDQYDPSISAWAARLMQGTQNINFSISIASHEKGVHKNSISAAAEIMIALSTIGNNGEQNFHFTASANCPAGIPFFPAAFHEGPKSFAVGLELPNLLTRVFSTAKDPRAELKAELEKTLKPVQAIAENIEKQGQWLYSGIDVSPAPGLDASIGKSIETLTHQPFGSPSTLSACALITDVLKNLNVRKCGYSGLMLPVIEDKVLAQRADEGRFTVQELLLYSSVSGTGLDVILLPGNTPKESLERILTDVASLSLKYTAKALSARFFLIPGKNAGDRVEFKNKSLAPSRVMHLDQD